MGTDRGRTALTMRILGVAAILFGVATLRAGVPRLAGGDTASLLPWLDVAVGLAYAGTGVGLLLARSWAARLAVLLAFLTAAVSAALGARMALAGGFEVAAVAALVLRALFWAVVGLFAWRTAAAGTRGDAADL
ncbi:hypothetical protein [Azospirillum sp. ST 5-10]|uniref:hypothetical protein n=1 Tax=unclassified Azospirillum TaxID=2630922 RepID=UPI003F49D5D6